jgi:hypothetical protein
MMRETKKIESNDRNSFDFTTIIIDENIIYPMIKSIDKSDAKKDNRNNNNNNNNNNIIDKPICCYNCLTTNLIERD